MIYIAILLLYLVTTRVSHDKDIINSKFKDLNNNDIDIEDYCVKKPCVIKCCDHGEILNYKGKCIDNPGFKTNYGEASYANLSVYRLEKTQRENYTSKKLTRELVFVKNNKYVNGLSNGSLTKEFYLFEDGSIRIDYDDDKLIPLAPFHFCLDYLLDSEENSTNLAAVFEFDELNYNPQYFLDYQLLAFCLGLLYSFISIGSKLFCYRPRLRRAMAMIVSMFSLCIVSAYTVKMAQLGTIMNGLDFCRIISPALYFFILSSFIWSQLFIYDIWWRTRGQLNKSGKFYDKLSCLRIASYHLYAFGIPLLLTAALIAVDKFHLNTILPIERSPFDSCFANETKTMWYLHIPVSILILMHGLLSLMNVYVILSYEEHILGLIKKLPQLQKNRNVVNATTKHRAIVTMKILSIIIMTCLLILVKDIPSVLVFTLHVCNICILIAFFRIIVFRKTIFAAAKESSEVSNKLDAKTRARQYLDKIMAKVACATIIRAWNTNNEDTKKLVVWTTDADVA